MAQAPLDCPESWRPVQHIPVGAEIFCRLCNRRVGATGPPAEDYLYDPWAGSRDAKIAVHWYPPREDPPQ